MTGYSRHAAGAILQAVTCLCGRIRMEWWRLRLGSLGRGSFIYPKAVIYSPHHVHIGARVSINDFVHIRGLGGVEIGDDALIAPHAVITSQSHDVNALTKRVLYRETNIDAPIRIGANAWIGAAAIILPGVTIGESAVVAAGSVVRSDVAAGTVVAGVPARLVRQVANGR